MPGRRASRRIAWTILAGAKRTVRLAMTLTQGGDWRTAAGEYAKLAGALPYSAVYLSMTGLADLSAGDSLAERPWLLRVAALPSADVEMRAVARAMKQP